MKNISITNVLYWKENEQNGNASLVFVAILIRQGDKLTQQNDQHVLTRCIELWLIFPFWNHPAT